MSNKGDVDLDDGWENDETYSELQTCADRWKNAGPEERKKMFSLFDETGIFIACCRHRVVVAACDMVKSGELYVHSSYFSFFGLY